VKLSEYAVERLQKFRMRIRNKIVEQYHAIMAYSWFLGKHITRGVAHCGRHRQQTILAISITNLMVGKAEVYIWLSMGYVQLPIYARLL
jgi:hypothetical protein